MLFKDLPQKKKKKTQFEQRRLYRSLVTNELPDRKNEEKSDTCLLERWGTRVRRASCKLHVFSLLQSSELLDIKR